MIPVIWSSDAATVVLKPAGLATQAPPPHDSLEMRIREQFADRTSYIAFPHRLDRPVGGLILVAFTKRAARLLGEQFEARRVAKTYVALVQGRVDADSQRWTDFLRKVDDEARVEVVPGQVADKTLPYDGLPSPSKGTTNLEVRRTAGDAKLAELQMRVIQRGDAQTLIELCPLTGRMHQLRVQAASRGHVIIGDSQYGSELSCEGLADGCIALQASKLEFNDPVNGKRVIVEAPPTAWRLAPA